MAQSYQHLYNVHHYSIIGILTYSKFYYIRIGSLTEFLSQADYVISELYVGVMRIANDFKVNCFKWHESQVI